MVACLALPLPATAHPSDFGTLTLDFLFGLRGLEAIDAAAVESDGPGYEPFPSSVFKRRLAVDVLQTLHVPPDTVHLDAEMSERYHEVGFVVRFDAPSLGNSAPLSIDASALRRVAVDAHLERQKVSVCGVADGTGTSDEGVLAELQIQAGRPGRRPSEWDREACEVWTVDATDEAISVVVRRPDVVGSHRPAFLGAIAASAVVFVAAAIAITTRRGRVSL